MSVLSQILERRLVAILRGAQPDKVLAIAEALQKGGIRLLEITMNSEKALEAIAMLSDKLGGKVLIGAGTVLDIKTAKDVIAAGAQFVISPAFDADVIRVTKDLGVISIPGAYTPTEILQAHRAGGDIIKVFPAPNAQYLKDVRAPLSHIPMMPTGGVRLETISEFDAAGAVAFGLGSALVDTKQPVTEEYLNEITRKSELLHKAINLPVVR